MSKKIAGGARAIVLDVKTGNGAFMDSVDDARELAATMVSIGDLTQRKVSTIISDMNQPLGQAVGNALEVKEAIDVLQNGGPEDFREHCVVLTAHLLLLGNQGEDLDSARGLVEKSLMDHTAYEKFRQLVIAQGGEIAYVDDPQKLPQAKYDRVVESPQSGYLSEIHARIIGEAAVVLGAGREKKGDPVDHAVGFIIHHNVGDHVNQGDPLFTIFANDKTRLQDAQEKVLGAHKWSDTPVEPLPLFYS
jgi:pyrimidine-nucleoside phosphorylase